MVSEVLDKLRLAILEIDGGCGSCISHFVEGANKGLSEYDVRLEYHEGGARYDTNGLLYKAEDMLAIVTWNTTKND